MLRQGAEAVTLEPDRRGTPEVPLEGWKRRCRVRATGHWRRFTPEAGLLMLFRESPQGSSRFEAYHPALDLGNVGQYCRERQASIICHGIGTRTSGSCYERTRRAVYRLYSFG